MPRRSNSSSMICSSATNSPPEKFTLSDGLAIDLRNIRSPIVVFCSEGDNVTPPQQALGWILDLYDDVDEIRGYGQTIIYTIHESIGHLGIFVSGKVARKQHDEFSSNIDLIDTLPPGLYEAVFEAKTAETASPDLAGGDWVMRCEARTLDDIRALGGNDAADEHCFEAVDRVSQANLALYRTFMQPVVRALVNPSLADAMRKLHPLRLQYRAVLGCQSADGADRGLGRRRCATIEGRRPPTIRSLPCRSMFRVKSSRLSMRGACSARHSPSARSWRLMDRKRCRRRRASIRGPRCRCERRQRARFTANLSSNASLSSDRAFASGGLREALIRALIFAGMDRAAVDERGFEVVRRIRENAERCAAVGVQSDRARAIRHAADRYRGSARRDSVDASGRCSDAAARRLI